MSASNPPERFSLKDHLFNTETIGVLAKMFETSYPSFDRIQFEDDVMSAMPDLELKQRITMITDVLANQLPDDYRSAAAVINAALPPPLDPSLSDDDFGDFIISPLGEYVARWGLGADDYQVSIALLKELTMRFSMEGPIRSFLTEYPNETLTILQEWATDPNYHVRRLVSEGTRPLLPWAPRIPIDVGTPVSLLDRLHGDPTRYVTRSVSNHLNDISKIDPDLAIATLSRWHQAGDQEPAELAWMTNHSMRTLVKKGDPSAMEILGYSPDPKVVVEVLQVHVPDGGIHIGDILEFGVTMKANGDEKLLVDYVVGFVKKNGSTRPKVFKLKKLGMVNGETETLVKRHRLPASATTFTLYPGLHTLSVMVNGNVMATTEFDLVD